MNILIIGGTQFLGYYILEKLLESGHQITVFHRGIHRVPFEGVKEIKKDWHNSSETEKALKGKKFDVVINNICFSEEDAYLSYKIFKNSTDHFIVISSAAVYLLNPDLNIPYLEEDALLEIPRYYKDSEKHLYAYGKREADIYFLTKFTRANFPCTILRPPVLVGKRDYTGRLATYFCQIEEDHPIILPDGGQNLWGFLYAEDLANFILKILKNRRAFGKVYNLAQREAVSLRQLILKIGKILGKIPKIVDIPSSFLIKTPLGVNFSPLWSPNHILLDINAAIRDFGFSPTPFSKWIEEMVLHFKKEPPLDQFKSTREMEKDTVEKYIKYFRGLN
ncbi:MAG: NAD-dependent epimerase/dehydratase family protein [Thermoanaerobaculia bacterium]